MIKEIVIKNVATYDDKGVTIDNIEKINYIYGANGCGKTTISNLLGNFELEKYSDCQVKWANNVAERVFVYNKTFREKISKKVISLVSLLLDKQRLKKYKKSIRRKQIWKI